MFFVGLQVGDFLKDRYEAATEVKLNKRGKLQVANKKFARPTKLDLVYVEDSPDYCSANPIIGRSIRRINRKSTKASRKSTKRRSPWKRASVENGIGTEKNEQATQSEFHYELNKGEAMEEITDSNSWTGEQDLDEEAPIIDEHGSGANMAWLGTQGRVCNRSSLSTDSCSLMCCGRGYNTQRVLVREKCNCKFNWCCWVKCDTCEYYKTIHTCK